MARRRTIDPDLFTDDKVQALTIPARYLYLGAISQADDFGRIEWSARQLRARIFPTDESVTSANVQAWMFEIEDVGLVGMYEVGGRRYAMHPSWEKHQYVNRPSKSKIPIPLLPPVFVSFVPNIPPSRTLKTNEHANALTMPCSSVSVSVSVSDTDMDTESADSLTATSSRPEIPKKKRVAVCDCLTTAVALGDDRTPEGLIDAFLGTFANCKTEKAQAKPRPVWIAVMREMRSKGHAWTAIWLAFAKTHHDGEHRPIHTLLGVWANLRASGSNVVPIRKRRSVGFVRDEAGDYHAWTGEFGKEPVGFTDGLPFGVQAVS